MGLGVGGGPLLPWPQPSRDWVTLPGFCSLPVSFVSEARGRPPQRPGVSQMLFQAWSRQRGEAGLDLGLTPAELLSGLWL